ncbi:MAG: putative sugar O-methyltransferase [Promethearchaeota archaeon]
MSLFINLIRSIGRKVGFTWYNEYLLKILRHPFWILKGNKIPHQIITFNKVQEYTQQDVNLCNRLIGAYIKATSDLEIIQKNKSIIWTNILKSKYNILVSAIEKKDPNNLAKILSSLFRQSFVIGIASGSLVTQSFGKIGSRIWSLKYLDNLVLLAEYLGVIRTETPEQGIVAYGLKDGIGEIVERIEKVLKSSIAFPNLGASYGINVNNSLITMESPEHIYVALRLKFAVDTFSNNKTTDDLNIVEIGGGFGGLAYWMHKLKQISFKSYVIIDLPIINVIQGYFLSKILGESKIRFYGESNKESNIFSIMPVQIINSMNNYDIDILINENSMPEMPEQSVIDYIRWAKNNLQGFFFSYNQEAFAPVGGIPQILVPEIISREGGLKRVSRSPSWLRTGYVEEIYKKV